MGEKIKTLSSGTILSTFFEIELNHPNISGQAEVVHIQSNNFRFELEIFDYISFATAVLSAEEGLKKIKNIK